MNRMFSLLLLCSLAHAGATLTVAYPDGTQVTIETASTGINLEEAISTNGVFHASDDRTWHRIVKDKRDHPVFAYDLQAGRASAPGTFFIRIRPIDPAYAGAMPTVSGVREFTAIRAGQSVALDILSNPATGDKIFDVLAPSVEKAAGNPPATNGGPEFVFQNASVSINGQAVKDLTGISMTGAAAMLYLPGRGGYFISQEARPEFQQIVHVDRDRLWFDLDYDRIEIRSKGDLLPKAGNLAIWVKHDRAFRPETDGAARLAEITQKIAGLRSLLTAMQKQYKDSYPGIVSVRNEIGLLATQQANLQHRVESAPQASPYMGTADNVDWLMPKK